MLLRQFVLRTWHVEASVVFLVLLVSTWWLTPNRAADWLAAAGVMFAFHYVSVGTRLQEKQAQRAVPDVECVRWMGRYLVLKEAFFVASFLMAGLYPPLVGSVVFLLYPAWRRAWRRRHPLR